MARKTTAGAAPSPSAPAVDLNLTPEEQAFLAQEALGFKLPSDIPDVSGPKLVDRIPGTVFMSADEVQAAALKQQEEDAQDEIFKTAILVVPFTFCFLLMDILIHQQYGRQPAVWEELGRLATTVPRTSLPAARVPFRRGTDLQPLRLQSSRDSSSTVSRFGKQVESREGDTHSICDLRLPGNRHTKSWLTQALLFGLGVLAGSRLIWVINKSGWLVVIQQVCLALSEQSGSLESVGLTLLRLLPDPPSSLRHSAPFGSSPSPSPGSTWPSADSWPSLPLRGGRVSASVCEGRKKGAKKK